MQSSSILLSLVALFGTGHAAATPQCKTVPSSPGWPTKSDWVQLNQTTGGHLLAALPPAIVCDKTKAQYSAGQCSALGEKWFLIDTHIQNPVSLQEPNWQQDGCLPSVVYNGTCDLHPFPKYTVNASSTQDIVGAVKFAQEHNLRLSVKNTGHDYLGRSTSPEFSIWTHYLKGIELHSSFKPSNCDKSAGVSAITAKAGNQLAEIYAIANKANMLVTAGDSPTVGLGGYLTGGGHSPVGAKHGLAVDNVVEMQMVTPGGDLVTANECQNEDLFWAMKGGGGSTFGVLVSATLKTFSNFPVSNFTLFFQSTKDGDVAKNNQNFYNLLADMFAAVGPWSDNYINGYFDWANASLLAGDPTPPKGTAPKALSFTGYGHNMTLAQLHRQMDPFVKKMNTTHGLTGTFNATYLPRVTSILSTSSGEGSAAGAGYNVVMGSRLWPKESLTNRTGLLSVFKTLDLNINQALMISGPAVRDESATKFTSVSPAWRKSYVHVLTTASWAYHNAAQGATIKDLLTNVLAKAIRDHAPDSGAYLNEADANEPNAPQTFWGSNYKGLLSIKRKYDPNGLFWCMPCVGHEDWTLNSKTGQLCRAH